MRRGREEKRGKNGILLGEHHAEDELQERNVQVFRVVDLAIVALLRIAQVLREEVRGGGRAAGFFRGARGEGLVHLEGVVEQKLELRIVYVDLLLHRAQAAQGS